ncbi:hypothetical protein NKH47_12305 [Mesorhizobium sp. M1060]|uniref:hypothetical protein n=1 Tax=Mesorhizobium sp. M1060 TaxID=2957052 RepID=UPI0033370730
MTNNLNSGDGRTCLTRVDQAEEIIAELASIRARPLADLQSKHTVPGDMSPVSIALRRLGADVGYPYADIGTDHRRDHGADRVYVARMAVEAQLRPIKIVITRCNRLWADNTHWALAALRKFGPGCHIGDVEHYVVRFVGMGPELLALPPTMGEAERREAIRLASSIQTRLDAGWRPHSVSYTIGQLFRDGRYGRAQ